MTRIMFTLKAVIEHPPHTLSPDQTEPLLKETEFQLTARTETEAKNLIFDDIHSQNQKLTHLEVTDKREVTLPKGPQQ